MGLALVLIYIALNLLSPADLIPSLAPFRPLLMLALASLPLSLLARLGAPEIGKLRTQFALVLLFFGFVSCSYIPHGWIGGTLAAFLEMAPNAIVYFVGLVQLRTPARLQLLRATLVMVALIVMVAAFSEIGLVRSTGASSPYVMAGNILVNPNDVRIRGLGVLHDPNVFGQFLLMILPMLFVSKRKAGLGPGYILAVPVALLLIVGVYYTNSRGAEMGLAVLIGLYLSWRFKRVGAVGSVLVGGLVLVVVNATRSRTISMAGGVDRLAIWSEGMQFFKQSPVWGIGFGAYGDRSVMTAHNSYLLCAAELGIIGYWLWMSMILVTIVQLSRLPKIIGEKNPELARWAVALRLSLCVYMFTGFFLSRAYDLPLFMLLGMSGAVIAASGGDEAIPLRGSGWPLWSAGLCVAVLAGIYAMLRLRAF
jgi:putative inorganic carbon (HCO3(-)) transporter